MTPIPDQLIEIMDQRHGMDVSMFNASFLHRSLEKRLTLIECKSLAAYLRFLDDNRSEAEALFRSLNVNFSEFFRNSLTFAVLEQLILPCLVEEKEKSGGAEIRIWSAGCASGQEAYSVAILLEELASSRAKAVPFRIFATDICEPELAAGRKGAYNETAIKNVRLKHLREYFRQRGESYTVVPRLRNRVDFSHYDLLSENSTCPPACIFGDFDLIFCSNLLFYYRPDLRKVILNKMHQCLSPDGFFITGEAEQAIVEETRGFRAITPPAVIFQKSRYRR